LYACFVGRIPRSGNSRPGVPIWGGPEKGPAVASVPTGPGGGLRSTKREVHVQPCPGHPSARGSLWNVPRGSVENPRGEGRNLSRHRAESGQRLEICSPFGGQ